MVWRGIALRAGWRRGGALLLCAWPAVSGLAAEPWKPFGTRPAAAVAAADDDLDQSYYRALTVVRPGSSSGAVRRQAVAELPLDQLSADARAKAQRVLSGMALFRRLPTLSFEADRRVYQHFVSHPDVAVSTWRAMEISRFDLRAVAPGTYHADAGDGSVGTVEVWISRPEETLIYCDGAFKSPLLTKPIVARSIMRVRTTFSTAADGRPIAEHNGDVFVEFPSQAVETVAKVISPVSHNIADRNFKQLTLYVHLMSQAMERQPQWIRAMVQKLDVPDDRKAALIELAAQTHASAVQRAAQQRAPLPVDDILAPLRRAVSPGEQSAALAPDSAIAR